MGLKGGNGTIQHIRSYSHKNSHSAGTIGGGGWREEKCNYNQWAFDILND